MNLNDAKLHSSKNEGQKNTAFDCGLSPCINELLNPTSMLRGAVIFVGVVVLVKCIFEVDALPIEGS
jgi:hypothetical protein